MESGKAAVAGGEMQRVRRRVGGNIQCVIYGTNSCAKGDALCPRTHNANRLGVKCVSRISRRKEKETERQRGNVL